MKIFEALSFAARLMEEDAVPNSRQDAELLLSFELKCSQSHVLAHYQEELEKDHQQNFSSLVEERRRGKPIQYILGHQEFYGLDFEVTPEVLIPRHETELVVEEVLNLFPLGDPVLVDVGTGSGCIAIALATRSLDARLWATDLSAAALQVARKNAAKHDVLSRIQFVQGDLLEPLQPLKLQGEVDCIVSNPPYVSESDLPGLQREVRDWEPRLALSGGGQGLEIYARLIPQARNYLKPHGYLVMEIGYNMASDTQALFDSHWGFEGIRQDLSGIPRVLVARKE